MTTLELIRLAERRGFLWTPCGNCRQRMVVARSEKHCLNCGGTKHG